MEKQMVYWVVEYVRNNYPDIFFEYQESGMMARYVDQLLEMVSPFLNSESKDVSYQQREILEWHLQDHLGPSLYHSICEVLSDDYATVYEGWLSAGIKLYEVANIISSGKSDGMLSGNMQDRANLVSAIEKYLYEERENEVVINGLQSEI